MQAEACRYICHRQGQQAGGTVIKRGLLPAQDFLTDAQERGVARLDQSKKGACGALAVATARRDGDTGQGGAVESDSPSQIPLAGDEIGFADRGGEAVERRAWFGVHRADRADGLCDIAFGRAKLAREAACIAAGHKIEIVDHAQ